MPTSMEMLPLDDNGIVSETFRVRHQDPGFNEGFGEVWFKDGLSNAITGVPLARIVAAIGDDLELVPVDDNGDPLVVPEPEPEPPPVEPAVAAAAETDVAPPQEPPEPVTTEDGPRVPCPAEPASAPRSAPKLDLPDNRDALKAVAQARGVDIDGRWGTKRIREAILAAVEA